MSLCRRLALTSVFIALVSSPTISHAKGQKAPTAAEQEKIVATVGTIFTSALTDDFAKFDSVIAPGFYIYDGGARFNGDSILNFIKAQHAAGKRYEWNITEPDVHIDGNTAWMAYVNKGKITDASGTVDQRWLESAVLQKQKGEWKIVFMHSTRVPPAAAPKS
ncbi:nuclear transport factor 2 family protein [Tunturiibacter lichenicola]|jgi:Domain of unknown function (DUF4440)|uniref:nuclear transport factor 2 family protein n=1 Tax=Tunturiibacter lichenicola TaxID=2051959 RepID=UPI0021B39D7F|nr:nuclear transport factor 2 family protein [Edaphobacter lichenicola]